MYQRDSDRLYNFKNLLRILNIKGDDHIGGADVLAKGIVKFMTQYLNFTLEIRPNQGISRMYIMYNDKTKAVLLEDISPTWFIDNCEYPKNNTDIISYLYDNYIGNLDFSEVEV